MRFNILLRDLVRTGYRNQDDFNLCLIHITQVSLKLNQINFNFIIHVLKIYIATYVSAHVQGKYGMCGM